MHHGPSTGLGVPILYCDCYWDDWGAKGCACKMGHWAVVLRGGAYVDPPCLRSSMPQPARGAGARGGGVRVPRISAASSGKVHADEVAHAGCNVRAV